jgi:hypothetical protein
MRVAPDGANPMIYLLLYATRPWVGLERLIVPHVALNTWKNYSLSSRGLPKRWPSTACGAARHSAKAAGRGNGGATLRATPAPHKMATCPKDKFFAQSHSSQAVRRMWPCKVLAPDRTKMFHVKHFGKGLARNRTKSFRASCPCDIGPDHLCRIDNAIKLFLGDEAELQRRSL